MYRDRTEQRRVTETMNSLLAPMLDYLNNDTAIIVRRALYLLGEIKIEPQETKPEISSYYGLKSYVRERSDKE